MNTEQLTELIDRAGTAGGERRRLEKIARAYKPQPDYERLLSLKEKDEDRFDRIVSPSTRIGLGFYQVAKTAAAALQEIGDKE
jgi:hypothetical protein